MEDLRPNIIVEQHDSMPSQSVVTNLISYKGGDIVKVFVENSNLLSIYRDFNTA